MNKIIGVPNVISVPSFRRKNSVIIDEVFIFKELLVIYMPNFKNCLHKAKHSKKTRVRKKYANKISNECTRYAELISNK